MGLDTMVPFTYREGLAGGLTKHALHSSAYRRLLHGVYLSASANVDGYVEARAALLASRKGAFASFHTAARLWGGIVPDTETLHISVPRRTSRSAPDGLTVHASGRTPVRFRGQSVTSPVDTFLDLATCLNLLDLVVLGDSLVRKGRTAPAALVTGALGKGRGMALARRAAGLVRKGVDSPMETRSRMLRVLSGLPELETDLRFYDAERNLRRRLDAGDRHTRGAVDRRVAPLLPGAWLSRRDDRRRCTGCAEKRGRSAAYRVQEDELCRCCAPRRARCVDAAPREEQSSVADRVACSLDQPRVGAQHDVVVLALVLEL